MRRRAHLLAVVAACATLSTVNALAVTPMAQANSPQRVVLVTGANKGVGFETARRIGALPDHAVVLGCRDEGLGRAAAEKLMAAGCSAVSTRLDLTDASSIEATRAFILKKFGRLDALVNNAAVCFNDPTLYGRVPHTPFDKQARITMDVNYHGTLAVTRAMLPMLRASKASPRIVMVASSAGRLRGSPAIQAAMQAHDLNVRSLSAMMEDFVKSAEGGTHLDKGWPNTGYGVSKMGLIALTRVLAREEPKIMVNSADPGYCATDQNANQGTISAEEGSATQALLAHAPFGDNGEFVSGEHWYQGRVIPWSYQ